ncbi:MAG: carbonic anhydrase [Proteobacteria bacterium]|nr:carbonic anhydrase [Pseudomonadota bacterium]
MISANQALLRLQEGNLRFRSGGTSANEIDTANRNRLVVPQTPFAIILGCSDSRVPAEIIFGQGLGELFVIRVAGNIVAPSQIGSIEFAAEKFGTRLVVVLGHSMCGAVEATLEQLVRPTESRSPNLHSIVDRIRPAVQPLIDSYTTENSSELLQLAVRRNIEASVANLLHGSAILEDLVENDGLMVVGAEYCLESQVVEFLVDA